MAARELFKYKTIEQIDLVDIDPAVTKLSTSSPLMRKITNDALFDSRVNIHHTDGMLFLQNTQNFYDAIIIDTPLAHLSRDLRYGIELLSSNGVLYTIEPETPVGDYDELDDEGKAKVDGFNAWIELIHSVQSTHHVAFVPLFGGTIVAFFKR